MADTMSVTMEAFMDGRKVFSDTQVRRRAFSTEANEREARAMRTTLPIFVYTRITIMASTRDLSVIDRMV